MTRFVAAERGSEALRDESRLAIRNHAHSYALDATALPAPVAFRTANVQRRVVECSSPLEATQSGMKRTMSACVIACVLAPLGGCGPRTSFFDDDGGPDANDEQNPFFWDAGDSGPCVNLACNVQSCGGGGHTTVSGTVYDPAGRNPLYNVYVYVPNAAVEPIPTGAVCAACQAPASGSPLPGAVQTDALGHFTVTDVPVGTNIPLVMQAGKFRRQIVIPQVNACVDNPVGQKDGTGLEMLTRLPRTQNEGNNNVDNLPQIAVATGGCDQLECLMRKIGIDDSEFSSTGRVHLFAGNGGATGPGSTDAYAFWANESALMQHDIVVNSCECAPFDRDTAGQPTPRCTTTSTTAAACSAPTFTTTGSRHRRVQPTSRAPPRG